MGGATGTVVSGTVVSGTVVVGSGAGVTSGTAGGSVPSGASVVEVVDVTSDASVVVGAGAAGGATTAASSATSASPPLPPRSAAPDTVVVVVASPPRTAEAAASAGGALITVTVRCPVSISIGSRNATTDVPESASTWSAGGTTVAPERPTPIDAAAAPTKAVAAVAAPCVAPAATAVGKSGSWASHDSGPMATRSRPSDTFRNARTTAGSNWVPEQRASSARASADEIGFWYDRTDVITSYASATDTMRPATEMSSPASPRG